MVLELLKGIKARENGKQIMEVVADGIDSKMVHIGRTGGLPICDPAWYRRMFTVDATSLRMFTKPYCNVFSGKCIVI